MIPIFKTGFSPCPNDTFLFFAWVHGITGKEILIAPHLADVESLNESAFKGIFPLTKLSFGAYKYLKNSYEMLPTGTALGWNCGPKLISLKPFSLSRLSTKTVAIPGRYTTAHLLLEKLLPTPCRKVFCRYDEIAHLLKTGQVDAGLIIHESRFTFAREGFVEICDLGELWHRQTALPLPLGGIAVKKELSALYKNSLTKALQASLDYSWQQPEKALSYILEHSRIKEKDVVNAHILLYITEDTREISPQGLQAIDILCA